MKNSLLFVKNPGKLENLLCPAFTMPYSTRYTDKIRQKDTRIKYFKLWDDAALFHQKACFVTLTLYPKNFDNLWDDNKDVMNAFHDLIDFIRKRIKAEVKLYPEFKLMYEDVKRGHTVNQEFLSGRRNILYRLLFEQYRRYKNPYVSYKDFKEGVDEGYFTHND